METPSAALSGLGLKLTARRGLHDRLRRDWMPRNARGVVRAVSPTERIADRQLGTVAESGQPRARPARR